MENCPFCANWKFEVLRQYAEAKRTRITYALRPKPNWRGRSEPKQQRTEKIRAAEKKPRNAKGSGGQVNKDSSPKPETGRGASPNKTRSGRVTHNLWISNAWINMFRMQHKILIKKYSYWVDSLNSQCGQKQNNSIYT